MNRAILLTLLSLLAVAPRAHAATLDVPRVSNISIDGHLEDWAAQGLLVNAFADTSAKTRPGSDQWVVMRLAWDDRGLIIALDVRDDHFVEPVDAELKLPGDTIEFWLLDSPGAIFNGWGGRISPGIDVQHPELRIAPLDYRVAGRPTILFQAARRKTPDGYRMELLLPWANLHGPPAAGQTIAFQIAVHDLDAPGEKPKQRIFHPIPFNDRDGDAQVLRLVDRASDPVELAAHATVENFEFLNVTIDAAATFSDKAVALHGNDRTLANATLDPDDAAHPAKAAAVMRLPIPLPPAPLGPLKIECGNQHLDVITPDLDVARRTALAEQELYFTPFVFAEPSFPAFEFNRPGLIDHLIGPHDTRVIFYDADHNIVTTAARPGRYGAVVELITPRRTFRKYQTLFRTEKPMSRRDPFRPALTTMPAALGIDSRVVQQQQDIVSEFLGNNIMRRQFRRDANLPILLAWLHEIPPLRVTDRQQPLATDERWWAPIKKQLGDLIPQHLVMLPKDYQDDHSRKWPMLLSLHGGDKSGFDLDAVTHEPLPTRVAMRHDLPMVLVLPQCPPGSDGWSILGLQALIDEIETKYRIDPDRIYVIGGSMGGIATWRLAIDAPQRYAAIAPFAAWPDSAEGDRIKDLPVWVFHGGKDNLVPIDDENHMVAALRQLHGRVRYSIYPDLGHFIAVPVYENAALYDWFLQQRRGQPTEPRAGTAATAPSKGLGNP